MQVRKKKQLKDKNLFMFLTDQLTWVSASVWGSVLAQEEVSAEHDTTLDKSS